jgi:hypothetical protein
MVATVNRCGKRTLALAVGALAAALRFANVAAAEGSSSMAMGGSSSSSSTMPRMAHMGSTVASHAGGMHSMAMGGVSMSILPNWLAVLWTLVFFVIIATHARHVLQSEGQRRWWHSGHVAMAIGMAFMFAPASIDYFNVPTGFWSLAFANGAIAIVLWMLVQTFAGRGTNLLWLLIAFDLGAMAYMWSPTGFQAPITWLLVAYFAVQAVLWGTNRMRDFR